MQVQCTHDSQDVQGEHEGHREDQEQAYRRMNERSIKGSLPSWFVVYNQNNVGVKQENDQYTQKNGRKDEDLEGLTRNRVGG